MTLDARSLKKRYMEQWQRSNARERFVKLFLDVYLPSGYEAELVGLGAGSAEYISWSYRGLWDAFDILIRYNGRPAAFLDVTGVSSPRDAKPGIGYCVGEWKIGKARRHGILEAAWAAFVLEDEPTILWAPLAKFTTNLARKAKLYEDERPVRCLPRNRWLRWTRFRSWLVQYAPHLSKLLADGVR